jgi:hypothetical protein
MLADCQSIRQAVLETGNPDSMFHRRWRDMYQAIKHSCSLEHSTFRQATN